MQGRLITENNNVSLPVLELNTDLFHSGVYLLKVGTKFGKVQSQFIIE
jgi:hypothetical protein